jgi:hypothetical protein
MENQKLLDDHKRIWLRMSRMKRKTLEKYNSNGLDLVDLKKTFPEFMNSFSYCIYCEIALNTKNKEKSEEHFCRYCPAGDFSGEGMGCLGGLYKLTKDTLEHSSYKKFRRLCTEIAILHTKNKGVNHE